MLLTIDIGNTNVTLGLYREQELVAAWRLATVHERMPDEYGLQLLGLLAHAGCAAGDVTGIALASVVPPLTAAFLQSCQKYIGQAPLVVDAGVKTGVRIRYEDPKAVGADRVVDAAAVQHLYGGPACIVDFGTGTTFDAISAEGEYLGGAIAPGIQISAEALYLRTAKLPRIEVVKPKKPIGKTTVASMQSGIYFGYIGLVNNIIAEISRELGTAPQVVVTGGFASQLGPEIHVPHHSEPHLVLEGLRILFDRNTEEKPSA
jgi:type III pantothenate kinase